MPIRYVDFNHFGPKREKSTKKKKHHQAAPSSGGSSGSTEPRFHQLDLVSEEVESVELSPLGTASPSLNLPIHVSKPNVYVW